MFNYNSFSRRAALGEDWKLVDQFNSAYWSGGDLQVYVNDVFLDEAIQLNYQIIEQARPYYGYASYIAQRIHHGARIITGELTINTKNDGFIFSLVRYLRESNLGLDVQDLSGNLTSDSREVSNFNPLLNLTEEELGSLSADQISDLTSKIKASRKSTMGELLNSGSTGKYSPRVSSLSGVFETSRRGFDLSFVMGVKLDQKKALRFDTSGEFYLDGSILSPTQDVDPKKINATGMRILGVSIVSQARALNDSGQGFVETYTFQARDLQVISPKELRGVDEDGGKISPQASRTFPQIETDSEQV